MALICFSECGNNKWIPHDAIKHLSKQAQKLLTEWQNQYCDYDVCKKWGYKDIVKLDWDTYFMNLAFEVSKRSPDSQTQHGTILVSKTNEVIATGYNGHIRNIEDGVLPNLRPEKYSFMIHSEINALLSCARQGKSTFNAKAYITGPPCLHCFQCLWQAGIVKIIHGNKQSHMLQNEEDKAKMEILKELTKHNIIIRQMSTKNL